MNKNANAWLGRDTFFSVFSVPSVRTKKASKVIIYLRFPAQLRTLSKNVKLASPAPGPAYSRFPAFLSAFRVSGALCKSLTSISQIPDNPGRG